jgi:hypothetical protein
MLRSALFLIQFVCTSKSGFRATAAAANPRTAVHAGGGPERICARERQVRLQAVGAAPRHLGGMYAPRVSPPRVSVALIL